MKNGSRSNALLVELLLVIFFFMISAAVLPRTMTEGVPITAASRTTMGAASYREGNANTLARLYSPSSREVSVICPSTWVRSWIFRSTAFWRIAFRSMPWPASSRWNFFPCFFSSAQASITVRIFFFQSIWPTKRIMGSAPRLKRRVTSSTSEGCTVRRVAPLGMTCTSPWYP